MVRHAESIKRQTAEAGNLWEWAKHDIGNLDKALDIATPPNDISQKFVVTSSFDVLSHQNGNGTGKWLTDHLKNLDAARQALEVPLSELVSIHNIKLKNAAGTSIARIMNKKKKKEV